MIEFFEDQPRIRRWTNETYKLDISVDGTGMESQIVVDINAQNYFGARHALESLSQFWGYSEEINADDQSNYIGHFVVLNDVSISDGPEFKHRGALIDTSRNFISKVGWPYHLVFYITIP